MYPLSCLLTEKLFIFNFSAFSLVACYCFASALLWITLYISRGFLKSLVLKSLSILLCFKTHFLLSQLGSILSVANLLLPNIH